MTRTVLVLNGPNLNRLGKREPQIYGHETLADVEAACSNLGAELGLDVAFLQTNAESQLVEWIHEACDADAAAIVINPAAFSHTSVAVLDALKNFAGIIIEVHISNIHQREEFRHRSFVSAVAAGVICGCGTQGYQFALQRVARLLEQKPA